MTKSVTHENGDKILTNLFFNNRSSRFRPDSSPWRPSPPAIMRPPGENDITDDEFS